MWILLLVQQVTQVRTTVVRNGDDARAAATTAMGSTTAAARRRRARSSQTRRCEVAARVVSFRRFVVRSRRDEEKGITSSATRGSGARGGPNGRTERDATDDRARLSSFWIGRREARGWPSPGEAPRASLARAESAPPRETGRKSHITSRVRGGRSRAVRAVIDAIWRRRRTSERARSRCQAPRASLRARGPRPRPA